MMILNIYWSCVKPCANCFNCNIQFNSTTILLGSFKYYPQFTSEKTEAVSEELQSLPKIMQLVSDEVGILKPAHLPPVPNS